MKRLMFLLVATLACSAQASEVEYESEACCSECDCCSSAISLELGAGYRRDNLKWAYPGFSPGVAIHEKWENIDIGYIEANSRAIACHTLLKVDFDYGWSGWQKDHHVTLIDYNSEVKTRRPHSEAKAEVYDVSVGIGPLFYLNCLCLEMTFTPLIGWSYNHQTLKNHPFYGNGHHHDSRYSWNTGWLGFEAAYDFCCDWLVYLEYSFHLGYYHAKIDEFFRDRHKKTNCFGNEVTVGTVYQWCDCWNLGLKFKYRDFWTHSKHSTYETADGKEHDRQTVWDSYSIGVDLGYAF